MKEKFRVNIENGKYTYIFYEDGSSEVLRYNSVWRDTTGDKLIHCMALAIMKRGVR